MHCSMRLSEGTERMQQNSASQVPWHENDALFRSLQRTGRGYEGYVAALLIGAGLGVEVQPMQTRPEYTDREAYRDYRDLIVVTPKGKRAAVEVKSRSLSFGCADTFPYDDIFVDTKKNSRCERPPCGIGLRLAKNSGDGGRPREHKTAVGHQNFPRPTARHQKRMVRLPEEAPKNP